MTTLAARFKNFDYREFFKSEVKFIRSNPIGYLVHEVECWFVVGVVVLLIGAAFGLIK